MNPKDTTISDTYTILTPLPQLILKKSIPDKVQDVLLKEGFYFSTMTPSLYRNLINLAKNKQCSDEIFLLLQDTHFRESGVVFGVKIPTPMPAAKSPLVSGVIYSSVADEILQRLFDCLLLFGNVPRAFRRSFWCLAKDTSEKIDLDTLTLLEPDWNYYDGEIKYADSSQADFIIYSLLNNWNKLSSVARIYSLNELFTNVRKQEYYNKCGKENILRKAEETIKARFGQDAHFVESDIPEIESESNKKNADSDHPAKISPQQSVKWFFQGWQNAYYKEIDKLTRKLKGIAEQRFARALQFFTDACRMSPPHKFVALTIPLEALFSTTSREITFQLSSRMAWFLEPDDFTKRQKLFNNIQDLYNIRSKIVHGAKYDSKKVEEMVWDLEDLNRRVFSKILSCDPIYKMLLNKNQKKWEQYLIGLNLGK